MSAVTHELRTPLTSIRAFTEILTNNPDIEEDQRAQFYDIILKESERLTRHINQVLDFAKIESGTIEWRMEIQPVAPAVDESIGRLGELLRSRGVEVQMDLGTAAVEAEFDRDRLIQVVINLISNAAKFSDQDDPKVWIALEPIGSEAVVTVTDNGPGVAEEHRELIFEKFQQVTSGDSGRPGGTGLGLPISREILSQMGGRLWAESAATGGAVFRFALPLAPARHVPEERGGDVREPRFDR